MKIENLTPEQEKKVQEYYQTYLSYIISTEPANKVLAEKTISEMYQKVGKDIPEFIWKDSPKSCVDYINENQLRNQLENQLQYQLWNQLYNQFEYQLREHLSDQLKNQLKNQLENQLGNQLYDQLYIVTFFWGQFDLHWIAHYKFCFNELPVTTDKESLETLNLWDQIGKSCSLWYPYENVCVISDRPSEISLDPVSIKFRDNWGC